MRGEKGEGTFQGDEGGLKELGAATPVTSRSGSSALITVLIAKELLTGKPSNEAP